MARSPKDPDPSPELAGPHCQAWMGSMPPKGRVLPGWVNLDAVWISLNSVYLNTTWVHEHFREEVTCSLKFRPFCVPSSSLPTVWLLRF